MFLKHYDSFFGCTASCVWKMSLLQYPPVPWREFWGQSQWWVKNAIKLQGWPKNYIINFVRRDLVKTVAKKRQIWYRISCVIFQYFLLKVTRYTHTWSGSNKCYWHFVHVYWCHAETSLKHPVYLDITLDRTLLQTDRELRFRCLSNREVWHRISEAAQSWRYIDFLMTMTTETLTKWSELVCEPSTVEETWWQLVYDVLRSGSTTSVTDTAVKYREIIMHSGYLCLHEPFIQFWIIICFLSAKIYSLYFWIYWI